MLNAGMAKQTEGRRLAQSASLCPQLALWLGFGLVFAVQKLIHRCIMTVGHPKYHIPLNHNKYFPLLPA
jgi:hypothetical protein